MQKPHHGGPTMFKKIATVIICAVWRHKFKTKVDPGDPVRCLRCERLIGLLEAKVNDSWV